VNQTYSDLQIICINDGSTDNCPVILDEYAQKDERLTVIHQQNTGQGIAKFNAFPLIRGKYTMTVDADDWIDLDTVEKCVRTAQEKDADVVVFTFDRREEDGTKNDAETASCLQWQFAVTVNEEGIAKDKSEIIMTHTFSGKLFLTELLLTNFTRPGERMAEDCVTLWQVIPAAQRIVFLPDHLYHYRIVGSSCCNTQGRHHLGSLNNCRIIYEELMKRGQYQAYRDCFLRFLLSAISGNFYRTLDEDRYEFLRQFRALLTSEMKDFYRTAALIGEHRYWLKKYKILENDDAVFDKHIKIALAEDDLCEIEEKIRKLKGKREPVKIKTILVDTARRISRRIFGVGTVGTFILRVRQFLGKIKERWIYSSSDERTAHERSLDNLCVGGQATPKPQWSFNPSTEGANAGAEGADENNKLISVVIPVYNVEKYLRECLDSVIHQTYRNLQIISVNDGSTDDSLAILKEYAMKDNRIEIIDKENGGLSSARNAAYPHIKGKYTLFIDSDDWIDPQLCEKVYTKAESEQADITVFFYQTEDEQGSLRADWMWHTISQETKTTVADKSQILHSPSVCCKLWRTGFLQTNNIYCPNGLSTEDVAFTWKAVVLASKIAVVQEPFYHYRQNPVSLKHKPGKHAFDILLVLRLVREFLETSGNYVAYKEAFHSRTLMYFYYEYGMCAEELRPLFVQQMAFHLNDADKDLYRRKKLPEHLMAWMGQHFDGMLSPSTEFAEKNYFIKGGYREDPQPHWSFSPSTAGTNENNELISVVIPVYNVEKYLRECLDSVIHQTYRNLQIICVNDGSTDGSLAILKEYATKDNRIEIIDKENGGLSSARNVAYPHIKGKYTLFIDSDD
jgi:glycosyltransferase involved in cell wall biosynthesis